MAGYILTKGANFTPFSYEELVRPIQQFTEAQNAAAQNFSELSSDAAALENYINETNDPNAYAMYRNYQDKLNTLQDNLWNKGYNAGTVRDLTAARQGYASDIARLAKAVESRQARSQEYWSARHKDKDLVAGADPGISSLDEYLKDSNYGNDWYSYNGNQFTNEIATEINARANELLRDPEIMKNPKIAGYITLKRREGFTNDEISRASAAAWDKLNGNTSKYDSLDDVTKIAADVLVDGMHATGATVGEGGNLTPDDYKRLFDYGRKGLAHGVRQTQFKDYEDKVWDYNRQLQLAKEKANLNNGGDSPKTGIPYITDASVPEVFSPNVKRVAKDFKDPFVDKNGNRKAIPVTLPDGSVRPVSSIDEFSSLIYDTPERRKIKEMFGLDLGQPAINGLGTTESRQRSIVTVLDRNGQPMEAVIETGSLSKKDAKKLGIEGDNPVEIRQIINGVPVRNDEYTRIYNQSLNEHNKRVNSVKDINRKNIDIDEYSRTPSKYAKLKERYGLPENLPDQYVESAVMTQENRSHMPESPLADASPDMKGVREGFFNNIIDHFRKGEQYYGSKFSKNATQSEYAFYEANEGGRGFKKEGTVDLKKVFGFKSNRPAAESLYSITVYPEDIIEGKVRITTDNGTFGVDPHALGDVASNVFLNPAFREAVSEMMLPFTETGDVLNMSNSDDVAISQALIAKYQDYWPRNENNEYPTLKQIALSPNSQQALREGITKFINEILSDPRELKSWYGFREAGGATDKPKVYNNLGY